MSATDLLHDRAAAIGSDRPDALAAAGARERRHDYGTIVVVGGGCYGTYYVRQLGRARRAGALRWQRLVVVDRDAACAVARAPLAPDGDRDEPRPELAVADWAEFFDRYLGAAAADPAGFALDAIVPSPLMPHLMLEWIERRARERWPGRTVERRPLPSAPPTPWQRASPDGNHYVSFAEWTCPVNCVEPARCPATRGPRDWSMPVALRRYVAAERELGTTMAGPALLHCAHRAYGVGMFDSCDVVAADGLVAAVAATAPADILIGTVSHCHGAIGRLHVGTPLPTLP